MSLDYSFYINSLKKVLFFVSLILLISVFVNKTGQKFNPEELSFEIITTNEKIDVERKKVFVVIVFRQCLILFSYLQFLWCKNHK